MVLDSFSKKSTKNLWRKKKLLPLQPASELEAPKFIDNIERLVQASTENKIIESVDFLRMNVAGSS